VDALRQASANYDAGLLSAIGPTPDHISETYLQIALRDGHSSTLKVTKPASSSSPTPGPLVVLFFSGAFLAGSVEQLSHIARALTTLSNCTVISASYRLAPENPFPFAVNDAVDSLLWAAEHATGPTLHADPTQGFVVGGASSGGNLAAVLARYFSDATNAAFLTHPLTGTWIGIAQLFDDHGLNVPARYRPYFRSREANARAPVLDMAALLAGSMALRADQRSSLRFPSNSTTGLAKHPPRTYLQVCGMDPLRDDGLIYDEMLREAGVQTKLDFYGGCPHGFWLVVPSTGVAKQAVADIVKGVGWVMGREIGNDEVLAVLYGAA
jgi:acetyl esterase/lipase